MLTSTFIVTSSAQNKSTGTVTQTATITPALLPPGVEAFRFRPGLVTQLDFGTAFDFTNSRWFGMGRIPAGLQTFYGLRFQLPNKSIIMGYNDISAINPRIEWIGNSAASTLGNLEFRVGSGFGTPGTPGPNLLVATMTSGGNTIFGNPSITGNSAKVSLENSTQPIGMSVNNFNQDGIFVSNSGQNGVFVKNEGPTGINVLNGGDMGITVQNQGSSGVLIENDGKIGLEISTVNTPQFDSRSIIVSTGSGQNSNVGANFRTGNATFNTGISLKTTDGKFDYGVQSIVSNSGSEAVGLQGITGGSSSFEAGIYGQTPQNNGNQFAGFFDGEVFSTVNFTVSDTKLKENMKVETNVLDRLSKLNSYTYDFKNVRELNLPRGIQHGFLAQEVAAVFPELTRDIKKPVFDKDGKSTSNFEFKSVNYNGIVSVLTTAVNELNTEMKVLKEELAELKSSITSMRTNNGTSIDNNNGIILEQNIPNPFTDKTTIKYQLPQGTSKASLMVFDLNGRIVKEFVLTENKSELTIDATQIGKGLFIYSLLQNGQELMTKKMIIK